jgi:peptidoglycan hydrolase CwlO-like protein
MRGNVYMSLGTIVVISCVVASLVMLISGGKVFDVGSTIQQNKAAISEVKREVDTLKEQLSKSMAQDKSTLDKVTKGHDEREAYQNKYLSEIEALNTKVAVLENDLVSMAKEHRKRLSLADRTAEENKRLSLELLNCERRRGIK